MKYPCCNRRCLLGKCESRENGGCICICSMWDQIHHIEGIMQGRTLYDGIGMQYIPDDNYREKVFNSWSEEKKEIFRKFKDEECPRLLIKYKEKLKEYEI